MLEPDNRSTLLELLEPPAGYDLDAAVGLTYTLDLDALLTLPTAFALSGGMSADQLNEGVLTPLELLDALRKYAAQITVCCDAAGIVLPASARSGVFAFLEKTVLPVRAPRGGVFHPKLWAVRFSDSEGRKIHRILIASRNLTFDRSWDTVIRLEQDEKGDTLPGVATLLESCAGDELAVGSVRAEHSDRLKDVARTIRQARFAPPAGFDSMRFHSLGVSATVAPSWPFQRESSRLLVVSPFLKLAMLKRLPCEWSDTTVVSRPDELDRELAELAQADADESSVASLLDARTINATVVQDADESSQSLNGLHAKLFVLDCPGGTSHVYSGSANATNAAFGRNVEVLIELVGKTRNVGVGRFLDKDGLAPLLVPHVWGEPVDATHPEEDRLDDLRRALSTQPVTASVSARADGRFDVRYRQTSPLPELGDVQLSLRPITVATWTRIENGRALDETFVVDELGITAFLGVRIEMGARVQTFLLAAELSGVPEGRDSRIIAALLANPERLVRFLMMLLLDPGQDRFDAATQVALEHARHATLKTLPTIPLMEVMTRALLAGRKQLGEVDRLLATLEDGADFVDPELLELWQSIREAAGLDVGQS